MGIPTHNRQDLRRSMPSQQHANKALLRQQYPLAQFISDEDIDRLVSLPSTDAATLIEHTEGRAFDWFLAGFDSVQTNEQGDITAIVKKSEVIALASPLQTRDVPVFQWMQELLLTAVPNTMKKIFLEAWATPQKPDDLVDIARRLPQCTTLLVQHARFTLLVEEALRAGDLSGLEEQMASTVRRVVDALRGPLTKDQRLTFSSLVTLAVGQVNVADRLVSSAKTASFEELWHQWNNEYVRCYVIDDMDSPVMIQCGETRIPFGFNYYRRPILVQTPLTHEVYAATFKTLSDGPGMFFAHGPPGTGKTETQKDFVEQVLGYKSVVINSNQHITMETARQFALAAAANPNISLIFDEFNRLSQPVAEELVAGLDNARHGRMLHVAFTYNSKAEHRIELPARLESMPSIAMTVPQYERIVEVMLASEGFTQHRPLAPITADFFAWCQANLTKQNHYDFGLRAIKAFVTTAGGHRRAESPGSVSDEVCVYHALWSYLTPRFTSTDLALAEAQLRVIFPTCEPFTASEYLAGLPRPLREAIQAPGTTEAVQHKLAQVVTTSKVRHGLGVLTSTPRETMLALSSCGALLGTQVVYVGHNDPSMTLEQLYGSMNEAGEWTDGIFTSAFRTVSRPDGSDAPTWLVVDAPMNNVLMEPMNSLLDDNKVLCLDSGERINLRPNVNLVYLLDPKEPAKLSPAVVSRMGMINFDAEASTGWFW